MAKTEVLELYELSYSELFLISTDDHDKPSLSRTELQRLDSVRTKIMEALGPTGPGLLSVSGVPNAASLRQPLSLARGLALLDPARRKRVLKDQNLGSDVPLKNPEREVSSFAVQLRYDRDRNPDADEESASEAESDDVYQNLGQNLKELGFTMTQIGLMIARVCDAAIGGGGELERSVLESSAAKGRLIHYHSELDRRFLRKQGQTKNGANRRPRGVSETRSDLWQQWHYDYGIFTVLTTPLFLGQQVTGHPNGCTLLQIFVPGEKRVFGTKASPESFIVQVGESAEVISGGRLRAALHSVAGPGESESLSRETFAVFLQPAWDKVLHCDTSERSEEKCGCVGGDDEKIREMVPPLSSRLEDGMTFAEFSRQTTRQYYGGSGLQSNKIN